MRGVIGSQPRSGRPFAVEVDGGHEVVRAWCSPRRAWSGGGSTSTGIDDLLGRGVYYGAGRSEAAQCGGEDVIVVGAGNSRRPGGHEPRRRGARVTMLVRGDELGKSMSAYLVRPDRAPPADRRSPAHAGRGRCTPRTARWRRSRSRDAGGSRSGGAARALFLCLGGEPRTGWAADAGVRTDGAGYILTGPDLLDAGSAGRGWPLARDPLALETSVPGLFAAGDARHGSTKRVAGAVGEGAMAVALAHRRLDELARGA